MKGLQERTALSIPLWLVWITALGIVLVGLGSYGILDNNEGLYAEIPREMLASHDWRQWIIPYLNGLPYMEKPPLLYWLTALSFALFGESEWSARVVPALSSLACVALLLWFGRAVKRPQAGRLAALMFVSGLGVCAMSRMLMFDMLLTALLTAALMCAYLYLSDGHVRFLRLAYAFLAFALLAKGFVALILFGLVIIGFLLSSVRSMMEFLRSTAKLFEPWAVLIFLAITIPWHVAASLTEPFFPWFYFVNEHILRFLGTREPHDYYAGAWWYYLPRMAIYLFPWTFLLLCLFSPSKRICEQDTSKMKRFLWLAWLMPLIFFTLSSAKANYYLVAVMPFVAFHLAAGIERLFLRPSMRAVPGVLIGALAAVLCIVLVMRGEESHFTLSIMGLDQRQFLFWVLSGLTMLAFGCAVIAWRITQIGILVYLALPVWIFVAVSGVLPAIEPLVSTRQLADYLQNQLPGRKAYIYRDFEERSSLPFYLKKVVPVIDSDSSDLFWGNRLRANKVLISGDQFEQKIKRKPVAVVVLNRRLEEFKATHYFNRFLGEKRVGETTVFFK